MHSFRSNLRALNFKIAALPHMTNKPSLNIVRLWVQDQYIFIHDALLEYILSGDTEVKDSNLPRYVEDLQVEKDGEVLLHKQYKVSQAVIPLSLSLFLSAIQQYLLIEVYKV